MMNQPVKGLHVFDTPADCAGAAAALLAALATAAIKERNRFVIALSGGSTPALLFEILASPPYKDTVAWENVFVFWGDERCVPANDDRNNAHMARRLLLDHVAIPQANVFPIPVEGEPADAAAAYEQTIRTLFGKPNPEFDCILLGLGGNGHTASLFPGTGVLHDNTHLVASVFVKEQNMWRVTMTASLINDARNVLFLVNGADKSSILHQVLSGPSDPDNLPAQMVHPNAGNLCWYIDAAAAAGLQ